MSVEKAVRQFGAEEIPMFITARKAEGTYGKFEIDTRLYVDNPEHPHRKLMKLTEERIGTKIFKEKWHVSVHLWHGDDSSSDIRDFETQKEAEDQFNLLIKQYNLTEEIKR